MNELRPIFKRYAILFSVQYGSSLTRPAPGDVDIALYPRKSLSIKRMATLTHELQKFFTLPLDLVELSPRTDPLFAYEIITTGKLLYELKKEIYENFSVYVWKCYLDTEKLRKLENQYIKKGLKYVSSRY